jgi:hypothetical protein
MERSQMTFYASFWDAIDSLSKKDQLPVFRAVVSYGLYGEHGEKLTPAQNAFFTLMQPVLDSSRKKAANGKHGGSKSKANWKQNASEKEGEEENEGEIEDESKKAADFERFWQAYPRKVGRVKAEAAFSKVTEDITVLLSAIARQKKSAQWQKDNGQFIPHPTTWLNGKRWQDELECEGPKPGGCRQLDEGELEAIQRMLNDDSLGGAI